MIRLAKWLTNIILGLAVLFFVFILLLPVVLSGRLAIVRSSSMEPALPAGSLAAMSPVDTTTIQVGDIIAFSPPWDPDASVSHRVMRILSNGFVTKGDAVEDFDPYVVPAESVAGKVSWHIPYLGYALNEIRRFATSIWGFVLLIVLPATMIFGSAIRDMNFMYNPGKRRARLLKKRQERLKKRAPRSWQLRRAR